MNNKANRRHIAPASLQQDEQAPILTVVSSEAPASQDEPTTDQEQPQEQPAQVEAAQVEAAPAEVAPVAQAAPVAPAPAPVVVPPYLQPLNQIQEQIRQMKLVSDRLDFLQKTSIELSEFTLGRTGLTDSLQIQDGTGKVWKTNKSETIQKVLDLLRAELGVRIGDSEQELRAFLTAA